MLDGLDAIDWRRYHHAYGAATDVPDLLRALADDTLASPALVAAAKKGNESVFAHVTWTLWGNVFHQGSVWGVSAKTVPFFVELLAAHLAVEKRRFIVDYLHHLALGYPADLFPTPFQLEGLLAQAAEVDAASLPQSVLDGDAFGELPEGTDAELAGQAGAVWMRDCYLAVERALPVISRSLEDVDDEVVASTIALLASFPRAAAQTVPLLWRVAKEELDSPLAGLALIALAQLGAAGVPEAARVATDAAGEAHLGGVFAAVADVLASTRGALSAVSQHRVLSVPDAWLAEPCPFTGTVSNLINRVMLRLPSSAKEEVVKRLGATLAAAKGFAKLDATGSLLRLANIEDAARLDDLQREVVRLIAEHGDWATQNGRQIINANQSELLRGWGLPTEQAAIRALAAR